MAKRSNPTTSKVHQLALAAEVEAAVTAWRNQGYHPFPCETTRQLLRHWFDREDVEGPAFHECQRHAIETAIYLHEIEGIRSVRDLYDRFAPQQLKLSKLAKAEAAATPFEKLCFKMATGSGKTWVLAALVVWQYFCDLNGETNAPFSSRFLVVAPGLEVRRRLVDSFRGKIDPRTGNRIPKTADYDLPLFMPDGPLWRGRFDLLGNVLEPDDLRANATPPDGPFVAVLNWQQFERPKEETLAQQFGLDSTPEAKRDVIADFLCDQPGIIVFNDEAHHVHDKKKSTAEGKVGLVWREFMGVLHDRMRERHPEDPGLFLQADFSATPFYGSGDTREYFPHIVYDYDLRDALSDMLVKQLFIEKRHAEKGQELAQLDFRAKRDRETREVTALSDGQKRLIDIGVDKLNQIAHDFQNKGLPQKPVLLILSEDTTVGGLVHDYLHTCPARDGGTMTGEHLLPYWTGLSKERFGVDETDAQQMLEHVDDNNHPLRVVNSVLKLREGFDKRNICVVVMLRSGEADLLLEQVVGRGLRLMFPRHEVDAVVWEAKEQAVQALREKQQPATALDFLYVVEHPRFQTFYDGLRKDGYLINDGDSSGAPTVGEVQKVPLDPTRIPKFDIAWPEQVHEEPILPDLSDLDVYQIPVTPKDIAVVRQVQGREKIVDEHLETGTRAATWESDDDHFDYDQYLRIVVENVVKQGRQHVLTGKRAEVADIVDRFTRERVFRQEGGGPIDFDAPANLRVLSDRRLQEEVAARLRAFIAEFLGQPHYETRGTWNRLSRLPSVFVRGDSHVPGDKCIYPILGWRRGEGFERDFMRWLPFDGEVVAWCKLQRKHGFVISWRDEGGTLRGYEPDFVVRTKEKVYLIETKSDRDLALPSVGRKAVAADAWCRHVASAKPPTGDDWPDQPAAWEYLVLAEGTFRAHGTSASLASLLPEMRRLRDQLVAGTATGSLFTTA